MHENKLAGETHGHKNGFAPKLVFTLRQRELEMVYFVKKLGKK